MKRSLCLFAVATLLMVSVAANASEWGIGAGLSAGTSGVREAAAIVTFDLLEVKPWDFWMFRVPSSTFLAIASTRDFDNAFFGIGLGRASTILNAGYNTEISGWEARLTVVGFGIDF